jgi:predicted dehydrogenase
MTNRRVRLAFDGGEHLHFNGLLRSALGAASAEVVGMAIADDELRQWFTDAYSGVPAYATSEELYDKAKPEAIITCADNQRGAAVVAGAAARGVHVMKEKPMAASLALAEQMATTAARHGIRLMINWPHNWSPAMHHAKRLIDDGAIGRVWQVHHRAGHGGPPPDYLGKGPVARVGWGWLIERDQNGGGAAIDFCSYGAVLSRWVMGQPSRVVAMGGRYAKEFFTVEDNAIMVLGYPRGHAVCEATWTQPAVAAPVPIQIYGEDGTIALTGRDELRLANRGTSGELSSTEAESVSADPLPDHYASGPEYFAYCLRHDLPFTGMVSVAASRDAQEILEAGIMSMRAGKEVGLPLPSFAT